MQTLQIIETAYRATLEEQDDTILWITGAMRGAGADLAVLLCGNAVNYAVASGARVGLTLGDWQQQHPPSLPADVKALAAKGVPVYAVGEDLRDRGIAPGTLLQEVMVLAREQLPALFAQCGRIWRW
jgi:hypothetical protein